MNVCSFLPVYMNSRMPNIGHSAITDSSPHSEPKSLPAWEQQPRCFGQALWNCLGWLGFMLFQQGNNTLSCCSITCAPEEEMVSRIPKHLISCHAQTFKQYMLKRYKCLGHFLFLTNKSICQTVQINMAAYIIGLNK